MHCFPMKCAAPNDAAFCFGFGLACAAEPRFNLGLSQVLSVCRVAGSLLRFFETGAKTAGGTAVALFRARRRRWVGVVLA